MTKIHNPKNEGPANPIEFVQYISPVVGMTEGTNPAFQPKDYDNVKLLASNNITQHYDVMSAWDDVNPEMIAIYFGRWNDGFVGGGE